MDSATSQPYQETQTASGLTIIETKPKAWYDPYPSDLDWYFPKLDSLHSPKGNMVIVQLQRTKLKSAGGIALVGETQETIKWNTQIAKVVSLGPIAYKNRETYQPWPEGAWCQVDEFVRVPRWGGDRWELTPEGEEEPVLFVMFNDHEIRAGVTGSPTQIKAFIL